MLCSSFEPFILVGLQKTMGLPSLMPTIASNAFLYSSCAFYLRISRSF